MIPNNTKNIIILDGHDGSGKTTMAKMLCTHLGGSYAKPFQGIVSDEFYKCIAIGDYYRLDKVTREAVFEWYKAPGNELLIFDRHWLTMFSLLPEKYYKNWYPLPKTILCWADAETTFNRLTERGETKRNTLEYHNKYCKIFMNLGRKFEIPVIDTSQRNPHQSMELLLPLLRN